MTRISETPATAPAANWYMNGSGLSVDMLGEVVAVSFEAVEM